MRWNSAAASSFHSLPVIGRYIGRMFPPDWSALDDLLGPTLDTICIALWGTVIASSSGCRLASWPRRT